MTRTEAVFPLDSYREAAPHLRRPFTAAAVKFKVQATWPKNEPTGGLIVAYIDARLAVERLNLIVPHLWEDEYLATNRGLMCALTVDRLTRRDVGEGDGKGLVSDAFKRAAVKFGVGVSLYAIPKMTLNASDGHLKPRKDSLELTPAGEKRVRSTYERWLADRGNHAFGDPLDHGDLPEAQGDAEVDDAAREEAVTAEDVAALQQAAEGLSPTEIMETLQANGVTATAWNKIPVDKVTRVAKALASAERKS